MGLKKLSAKLTDYKKRLDDGKAKPIKANHVEKVLRKLRHKEAELMERAADTKNPDKLERLTRKQAVAREQISRAEWLLDNL